MNYEVFFPGSEVPLRLAARDVEEAAARALELASGRWPGKLYKSAAASGGFLVWTRRKMPGTRLVHVVAAGGGQ